MNCRQFRNRHVPFVDDLLSSSDMRAMRDHVFTCDACARIDVRIRRSLMVVRSMPRIEPSDEFLPRLTMRLQGVEIDRSSVSTRAPSRMARSVLAVAAGLVAIAALTYGVTSRYGAGKGAAPMNTRVLVTLKEPPVPIADAAVVAAVPTGIPMWSAMLAAGQLPMRFVSADLVENEAGQ